MFQFIIVALLALMGVFTFAWLHSLIVGLIVLIVGIIILLKLPERRLAVILGGSLSVVGVLMLTGILNLV